MRPLTAIATVLLVAGPWFALVGWRTHGEFLKEFFGTQNFGRFTNAMDNHGGGIWYYVPAILCGFFPWSIFGIPTTIDLVRRCRGDATLSAWGEVSGLLDHRVRRFLFAGQHEIAELCTARLSRVGAGDGVLFGSLADAAEQRASLVAAVGVRFAAVGGIGNGDCRALVAYGKVGGRPVLERLGLAPELRGDLALVGLLGVILIVGGVSCIVLSEVRKRQAAVIGLTIAATAFCLAFFAGAAVRFDRYQPSPGVAEAIRSHADSSAARGAVRIFPPQPGVLHRWAGGKVQGPAADRGISQ